MRRPAPEKKEVLLAFYRKVHPSATFWGPIAREATDVQPRHDGIYNLLDWVAGCAFIYLALFGMGKVIFGEASLGLILIALGFVAAYVIYWDLNRRGWQTVME